jgi:DNA polymerase-3 subunit beta
MRFIVSSSALLKNLQLVGGIISSNTVMPILENFLFELKGNFLSITGCDLETMIKTGLEVQAEGGAEENDGKVCVTSKILLEYLKNLPDQPITFNVDKKDLTIEITSNSGKYKIGCEKTDEYPKEPNPENATTLNIPSSRLAEAINKTIFATSSDTLRPAMTGVYFELNEGDLTFVATDAHRLIRLMYLDITPSQTGSFIVPRKPLQQMKNWLPNDDSAVTLSYTDTHLFIKSNNTSLNCRLIDGKYPPYRAVIPADNPFMMTINRTDLINALRRVSVFADKSTTQVVFDIVGNTVSLSAQYADFSYEGNEKLNCQFNGEDMKIAFNARLLVEMLNNLEGEEVALELSIPSRAGIFKPTDNSDSEDLLMLLMPLMVNI